MATNDENRTPGWVRWIVGAFLVVLFIGAAAMLLGGGQHGPWRHFQNVEPAAD